MINLRYHIVSLVAVFLALAIGVIAGTTVIDQEVVKGLRATQNLLATRQSNLRAQNDQLNDQLALWQSFGAALAPPMISGKLRGKKVVLMLANQTVPAIVGQIEQAIVAAGGTKAGRLIFSSKWLFPDDASRQQLVTILGDAQDADRGSLLRDAASRFATRMQAPEEPNENGDLLMLLARDGFLSISGRAAGRFPPSGALYLWVSSGKPNPSPPEGGFTIPLLRGLLGTAPLGVAEPLNSQDSLVGQVIGDASLRQSVATVDDVDTLPGRISLVAALHDVAAGRAAPHYGFRRAGSGVIPSPSP